MPSITLDKQCLFCITNRDFVNYKDTETLQKFISAGAKIRSRKKTGLCVKHQRRLARAVKRARYLALIPYTTR